MLRLTVEQLDNALTAIQMHGYGDFFPEPPELSLLVDRWDDIRAELVQVDLDLYEGHDGFAPKSRLNVRRVALLHPYGIPIEDPASLPSLPSKCTVRTVSGIR